MNIKDISTTELRGDLLASAEDIKHCQAALDVGNTTYCNGTESIQERLDANQKFITVIIKELNSRSAV